MQNQKNSVISLFLSTNKHYYGKLVSY